MGKYSYFKAICWQKLSNCFEGFAILLARTKKNNDIKVIKNISYSESKSKKAVCDYYYKESSEKKPIFIYIHGGGWISGLKSLRKYYCYPYAEQGYFVMNTDYDLAPKYKHPYQFQQIFNAIEMLLDNAEKYSLDTTKIFVGGESAGAYFTAFVAAMAKNHKIYDIFNVKFKYFDSFDVSGILLINGAYDFKNLAKIKFFNMKLFLNAYTGMSYKDILKDENSEKIFPLSPFNYIDNNFPPTCIGYGEKDGLIKESECFHNLLKNNNIKNTSFLSTGIAGLHGFVIAPKTKEGTRCLQIAQDFFKEIINEKEIKDHKSDQL